ncbi:MAG: hypothetical protein ACFFCX_04805 [Candidatus Sifarchaeia archaeon]
MRRSPSRLLFIGFMALFLVILVGNITTTDAQVYPDDFIHDDRLYVYIALDGMNFKDYSLGDPLPLNMEAPMDLTFQLNASGYQTLNVSGSITFWYQGYPLFPIQIVDAYRNTWFIVDPFTPIPPVTAPMNFSTMMSVLGPLKLATGVFEASVDFRYFVDENTTLNILQHQFSFILPSTPIDIITSVTGIVTSLATVGAVYGVATGFNSLWEGLKTAYKLRGIHKKASEIRSLPNLTVLGALPLLFSLLDNMKRGKKEGREDSGISEYIVRQRLREAAPDAWQADKCPQCKRNWNKKLDMCKKCNIGQDEARIAYAELLAAKVPAALRWMGKKKSTDVKTLAKKTKSTQYNAGVIAASMVDTNVTEITKVGTPLRSFVMNIAGLTFLVLTWQQLLGDNTSAWQTTITFVGAALSLAVIIALYISRKSQIAKFVAEQEAGLKILPTQEEAAEAVAEPEAVEEAEEPEIDELASSFEETNMQEYERATEVSVEADEEDYSDVYEDENLVGDEE